MVSRKKPATTLRSTSGAGFDFEDQISAWLQIKMLAAEPAPAVGGQIIKIQAQVSALGWRIDDVLLTVKQTSGAEARLAISVKGNQQVSKSGLPADFVELAWVQWRDAAGPMKQGTDHLALFKRGAHPVFDQNWPEVKNACSGSDVTLALRRIHDAPRQAAIFNSVFSAAGTPADATEEEAVELIRHLHVFPVDFQLDHSEMKSNAISQCRRLLLVQDPTEADRLWNDLVRLAGEVRMQIGTVTQTNLWEKLRKLYRFRDHPDFAQDWQTLTDLTKDYKARIQTTFSSGHNVEVSDEKEKLCDAIRTNLVTVVIGESGTGKSALTKLALDDGFGRWTQVWLGPDEFRTAMSAAQRRSLPLEHELGLVLNASSNPSNVLVLDSAERIDPADYNIIQHLLAKLLPISTDDDAPAWRVVIVVQSQGWAGGSEMVPGGHVAKVVEQVPLTEATVKDALRLTPSIGWLADHDETIAVLTNLKILAWVVKAGAGAWANANGPASHADIADRLWDYWTGGAADVQSMMMRLSEREAQFERSFALSEFNPAEATTFANRPTTLPVRINKRTNRIEFEHDLAADWARFQYLKQFAHDAATWGPMAQNPLWTNALRMLGQFLLRQGSGVSTSWDQSLEEAEAQQNTLAADVLLDALCLDAEAERFLSERDELLLSNKAKRLDRLLSRFRHIGTIPLTVGVNVEASLGLYLEARYRTVIVGQWLPVLRFLFAHRERLENLASVAVVKLLETWLKSTPKELSNGKPVPHRRDAAEMALAIARTVQVQKGHGVMYLMDDLSLYTVPLAAADDLTDQVSAWALELSGRREADAKVKSRIKVENSEKAKRYANRIKTDAVFRKKEHEKKSRPFPKMLSSIRERLPPWPLGAKRRIDHDFRKAAFKDNGLLPLMRAAPAVAAEVLLALIIEDEPEYEHGSSRYEIKLGLEADGDRYPTMYWKSPFFLFLQTAEKEAIEALIALVNFCTERWVDTASEIHEGSLPGVTLQMENGTSKLFEGTSRVFGWVHDDSLRNGNLFCALDALERWLILKVDAGDDITPQINLLLAEGSSAFIGLLVNIAKYRPELLAGPLAPLFTDPQIFYWDDKRVKGAANSFNTFAWAKSDDIIFDMARDWALAPHRSVKLLSLVIELIKVNSAVADRLAKLIPTWRIPDDHKRALEFKSIFAQLDRGNYSPQLDSESCEEVLVFQMPEELGRELMAWISKNDKPLQHLLIPTQCEELLRKQSPLSVGDAQKLLDLLNSVESDKDIVDDQQLTCRVALAATLIVNCDALLVTDQDLRDRVQIIVREVIEGVGDTAEALRKTQTSQGNEQMKFAAHAAMHLWMLDKDGWEPLVLTLLTSESNRVLGTIIEIAYVHQDKLGDAWWRLLLIGILWSALAMLMPGFGEEDDGMLWTSWLRRLRRFRLMDAASGPNDLDITRVADGFARLDFSRQVRAYELEETRWRIAPDRRRNAGLDWDVLGKLFGWLTEGSGTGDWATDRFLIGRLWAHEIERQKAHRRDGEDGEYDLPSQTLGYNLPPKLAELSMAAPDGSSRLIWEPILSHGPPAHYSIGDYIKCLFRQLDEGGDGATFEKVWREMIEYALDEEWEKRERLWYRGEDLLCGLLGFGSENALGRLPAGAQGRMRDIYLRWAKTHLRRGEDCVKRFSYFLGTSFGASLRIEGICWIAEAFSELSPQSRWSRDGTGDALIELLFTAINHNARELTTDATARKALIQIAGELAVRNVPNALTLQERIRNLR